MAVDMFIKIGDIVGETQDKVHKGEIDVLAWSWGMSNSGSTHVGGGAGAGKVSMQDISLTTYVDKSSPFLMKFCANGTHIPTATLVVRKAGTTPVEFMKFTFTEVIVSSLSTGGSGGEDRLTQNISLNFAHIKYEYTPQDSTGKALTAIPFEFDIPTNIAK